MLKASRSVPLSAQAVEAVLADWKQRWPGLGVLALVPEAEQEQVGVLQACCAALPARYFPPW